MSRYECGRTLRDGQPKFEIKNQCFICGSSGTVNKKALISVCTGTGATTREKTLKAAIEREDFTIQNRMEFHPDLFASDAKYHKYCYSHYISERNIMTAKKKTFGIRR
jgi:hypothetical protein